MTFVLARQGAKTTEYGGARGYDASEKVKDHSRQAMVDTDGRSFPPDFKPAGV